MLKNYYKILNISASSSTKQIKIAYKKQALRWHPDRNPSNDTTSRMQEINEAYLILNDHEARTRYDKEYFLFINQKYNEEKGEQSQQSQQSNINEKESYEVNDDILRKWMSNARSQAAEMSKKSLKEVLAMTSTGLQAAWDSIKFSVLLLLGCLVIVIIIVLVALFLRSFK